MICPTCGTEMEDGAKFCPKCGNPVGENVPVNVAGAAAGKDNLGWAMFLSRFALWAGALMNLITAFKFLTGMVYGSRDDAEMVYAVFGGGLKAVDMISGVLLLVAVVVAVMAALAIIKFKASARPLVIAVYALIIAVNIFYVIATSAILGSSTLDGATAGSTVASIVFLIINIIYFGKRKHIFVN